MPEMGRSVSFNEDTDYRQGNSTPQPNAHVKCDANKYNGTYLADGAVDKRGFCKHRSRRGYCRRYADVRKCGRRAPLNETEAEKRQRMVIRNKVDPAYVCPECGKDCKNGAGLASHLKTHEEEDKE